jgi:hypothetical protein
LNLEVSYVESLEKYGLVGLMVFSAASVGAAVWWQSMIAAFESWRSGTAIRPLLPRALGMSLVFLVPLVASMAIIRSTGNELRRAAGIVEGRWRHVTQTCAYARTYKLQKKAGILTMETPHGFTFAFEIDRVGSNFVQIRPRGSDDISILKRESEDRLVEVPLSEEEEGMVKCS